MLNKNRIVRCKQFFKLRRSFSQSTEAEHRAHEPSIKSSSSILINNATIFATVTNVIVKMMLQSITSVPIFRCFWVPSEQHKNRTREHPVWGTGGNNQDREEQDDAQKEHKMMPKTGRGQTWNPASHRIPWNPIPRRTRRGAAQMRGRGWAVAALSDTLTWSFSVPRGTASTQRSTTNAEGGVAGFPGVTPAAAPAPTRQNPPNRPKCFAGFMIDWRQIKGQILSH